MLRVFPAVLLLVAWMASPTAAQSDSVTGIVIDHRTERAIPGVLVYVEGHPAFANTDSSGRFALTLPPGQYTIAASVIGYALLRAPIDIKAGSVLPVTFRMSEGAGSYTDRVTVSGTRRTDADAGPGSGALHGRELENLRGVMLDDPLRAIQAIPSATATDDFYSEFAVRGSSWRHVGLAVDGIPTKYLMHTVHGVVDGGSIAMINSETLGSVALHPGSYAQRTGRQLGAQVDLTTREGNREEVRGRAGLSGTSATLVAEGPLAGGRGSWLVSGRRSYLDYLIKRIDPDASFAFGFYDGQAKVVYDLSPAHQVSFTTLLGRAAFDEDAPDLDDNDRQASTSYGWLHAAGWRYAPGPRFAVTQRLYTTGVDYDTKNPFGVTIESGRSLDVGWRVDASFAPADGWLVEFGGDAQRLTGDSVFARRLIPGGEQVTLNAFDERASAASAYVQTRIRRRLAADDCARRAPRPLDPAGRNDRIPVADGRSDAWPTYPSERRRRRLPTVCRSRPGIRPPRRRDGPSSRARGASRPRARAFPAQRHPDIADGLHAPRARRPVADRVRGAPTRQRPNRPGL